MWFFDALASGFTTATDPGRLQTFRILFGMVLAARFALSIGQGGWNRFAPGSLSLHLAEQRYGPARARHLAEVYRPALVLRTVAATTLAVGYAPRPALVIVLAGAGMELLYLRSPNAVRYTLLTGTGLLLAGDLGHGLHITHAPSTANTWSQCLLVLITTDIYWNSAWQKLRSPQFRTGLYLAQWVHVYGQVKDRLPHRRGQYAVPAVVRRRWGNLTEPDIRTWRLAAAAAITTELALPPALLFPQTTSYAIAAGIAMHTAFTCLKPRQLITFSGLTTSTYIAFAS
ncbi:hypothetical protein K388_07145 [Streptomyces sp. KhCrAH-43]|uniref:hypothetical protein n=1 Tax=unclassified Streptomyces TaxID=2593676 RepID=UPI00035E16D0|nr:MULTISPECIES: hypothetical protein [unclassified Streptomyces]MYS32876.1 hypothetical protein [Streptomyces sp. SID4920]MYX67184.1 hypothetical protein [Streptomyces sp. SID8373]RAJ47834.1 hypothetical protein K388_07145 [Streptomyces sp. KhCrAH-43]